MQETVLYFQRETQKSQLNSDTMPHRQHADAPQPAAAAAPWTRCRASDAPTRHSPPQQLRLLLCSLHPCTSTSAQDLPPHPLRSAMAALVSSRSPLCPTLEAATTLMLTQTALLSSAWVATCGGAAISATAITTITTASNSSTACKGLGIPNLLMFQVGTY